ncbi:TPA: pilus protein [Escherichia coli]|nr:pilus protein [Escherichia coli]HCP1639627.1 pilus protein [Escherichia coli]
MEARQGGDSSAGSVHDSPPRQGDARKMHSQENNKTDSNQSNRKKKNSSSSRNNNIIISNRQMTGIKKQKPPSERPRNERGGASARPLSAPPARGLFPARADGHLSSRLPGVFRPADE